MHFDDLVAYQYKQPFVLDQVRCVGWLDASHPFTTGRAPLGLVERLTNLAQKRTDDFDIHVNVIRGTHPCNLCGRKMEMDATSGKQLDLGASELWIPCSSGWFASPSLVIHYIDKHSYLPPAEFTEAVFAFDTSSPYLGQDVYDRLIRSKPYKSLF
jgi:hypothetical protein